MRQLLPMHLLKAPIMLGSVLFLMSGEVAHAKALACYIDGYNRCARDQDRCDSSCRYDHACEVHCCAVFKSCVISYGCSGDFACTRRNFHHHKL
jgi:hypothetical protein